MERKGRVWGGDTCLAFPKRNKPSVLQVYN